MLLYLRPVHQLGLIEGLGSLLNADIFDGVGGGGLLARVAVASVKVVCTDSFVGMGDGSMRAFSILANHVVGKRTQSLRIVQKLIVL